MQEPLNATTLQPCTENNSQRSWTTTTPPSCTEMESPLSRSPTLSMYRNTSEDCAKYMDVHQGVLIYPEQFAREGLMQNHLTAVVPNYRPILEDATQQQKATLLTTRDPMNPADNRSTNIIPESNGQGVKGGGTDPPSVATWSIHRSKHVPNTKGIQGGGTDPPASKSQAYIWCPEPYLMKMKRQHSTGHQQRCMMRTMACKFM